MKTETTEKGFDLDLMFDELGIDGKTDKFCRWLILKDRFLVGFRNPIIVISLNSPHFFHSRGPVM